MRIRLLQKVISSFFMLTLLKTDLVLPSIHCQYALIWIKLHSYTFPGIAWKFVGWYFPTSLNFIYAHWSQQNNWKIMFRQIQIDFKKIYIISSTLSSTSRYHGQVAYASAMHSILVALLLGVSYTMHRAKMTSHIWLTIKFLGKSDFPAVCVEMPTWPSLSSTS